MKVSKEVMMCCEIDYFVKMEISSRSLMKHFVATKQLNITFGLAFTKELDQSLKSWHDVFPENDYFAKMEKQIFAILDNDNYHQLVFFQQKMLSIFDALAIVLILTTLKSSSRYILEKQNNSLLNM